MRTTEASRRMKELREDAAVLGRLLTKHGMPKPANTTRKREGRKAPGKYYTSSLEGKIAEVVAELSRD